MLFWTSLKVALKSLLANKLRSFLATLGIIIGVGAVISMLALAGGAKKQIMDRVASMGTNLLIVVPGKGHKHGRSGGSRQSLKIGDAAAIMAEVEGIAQMAPVAQGSGQIKYFNKNTQCSITGTTITYFPIRAFAIDKGRCFTELEAESMARVAVLGPVTAENLFGENNPLGETIKIKGINFVVVGVVKAKGNQGWSNPDDQAIVPYTTLMKQIAGVDYLREIDIQAADSESLDEVIESISVVLRRRHRIQAGADDDFHVRNQAEILEVASDVTGTFTFLLGGIASISLLVGGIGIMNIMLVTVTERTREIGIRKAIGARDRDILLQFLFESLLLSGIGGGLGIAAGIGGAELIRKLTSFTPLVEPLSVALAFGVSASVGVFFGFYPAMRAAELDPIDALRYE